MLGNTLEEEISNIPLSNNTISCRIKEMFHDNEINMSSKLVGDTEFTVG